jgi:hypothetical protein
VETGFLGISYVEPAERAWARTRHLLLLPVDVEKWVVIGFAAFLAGLAGRAGFSFTPHWRFEFPPDFGNLIEPPFENVLDLVRGSAWFLLGLPLGLALLALGVALLWLSSRGKLIFLDNMVQQRAAFVQPWRELGQLGDSLFRWRLGFWLAALLLAGAVLWPIFWLGRSMSGTGLGRPFGALVTYGASAGSLVIAVIAAYVVLFLENFVVPLMYRRKITASEAWRQFLPLLRANLPDFLVYGLVVLFGLVAVFLSLIAAAIVTCCILPLLLSIPYVHSVLLLPLTGFYRLYSLEFLQQYGPDFTVLGVEEESPAGPD